MAVITGTDHFTKQKTTVQDANATMTFGGKQHLDTFSPEHGIIFLIGFTGSKRAELAELLGQKFSMESIAPEAIDSADELEELASAEGTIIIVPQSAMRNEDVRNALRAHGKVFYLMTELLHLAHNLGLDAEQGREQLGADFVELEPHMLASLHYILHGWKEPQELIDSVCEPLGLL